MCLRPRTLCASCATPERIWPWQAGRIRQPLAASAVRRRPGGREVPDLPPLARRCETAVRQFQLAMEQKGERIACLEMRRHYAWYLKGVPYASYWKGQISQLQTADDVYRVTAGIQRDLN